jgi:hypothetical protein
LGNWRSGRNRWRRVLGRHPSCLSTFRTFLREFSSRQATSRVVLEELSGVNDRPIIVRMPSTSRPQQRYNHRLRDLVQRTGDLTIATDLGVPRSTVRGWLGATPRVVVTLDLAALTEPELQQEILKLTCPQVIRHA